MTVTMETKIEVVPGLEEEWRRSLRLPDKELLNIFPEAKEIIPAKIAEWEEQKKKLMETYLKPYLKRVKEICTGNREKYLFWREAAKYSVMGDRLREVISHLHRLKRLQIISRAEKKGNLQGEFETAVEEARRTPILDVISNLGLQLRKPGKNYTALCPFHQEKHSSFYVYPDTNSFYCFGCNAGGDAIKFIELFQGLSFKEAVAYLTGGGKV